MRNLIWTLVAIMCFVINSNAQSIIRFKVINSISNTHNSPYTIGKIEQSNINFSEEVQIELPEKTLHLKFKPSSLKRYDSVLTSNGKIPSQVEIFEDINTEGQYFWVSIKKHLYGLVFMEKGEQFSLKKSDNADFIYQKNEKNTFSTPLNCNDFFPSTQSFSNNTKARKTDLSGCYEFSIGFVCDYYQYIRYQSSDNAISEMEADNLLKLASTQALWGDYTFNTAIHFTTIGQMIYTTLETNPWNTDLTLLLASVWRELESNWKLPNEWLKYKMLIKVGITGIDYGGTDKKTGVDIIGFGGPSLNQGTNKMGTAIIKGFLDKTETTWIFAHELGHVFGAGHDTNSPYYIMNPIYNGAYAWSPESINTINATMIDLSNKNWLRVCATLNLSWQIAKDSLHFVWQTNYDALDDTFTLEYSSDFRTTWKKVSEIPSNGAFHYETKIPFQLMNNQSYYFRVRQHGTNEITSNLALILLTAIEDSLPNSINFAYPNPFDNQLIIKMVSPIHLKIYDIKGRLKQQLNLSENQTILDTYSWETGFYFIQNADIPSNTMKIFKQ